MKIETTKQIKTEVEIELPHFRKTTCHVFKVINEKECLQVTSLEGWEAIEHRPSSTAFCDASKDSDEEFFNQQYDKVLKMLQR